MTAGKHSTKTARRPGDNRPFRGVTAGIAMLLIGLALIAGGPATGSGVPNTAGHPTRAMEQVRARTPAPGELVKVTGLHRQHLWCRGPARTGRPTVVVISGAGDFSLSWRPVQDLVAVDHRICTYDRAGLGWSSASPQPRTGRVIVGELQRLLNAGNVRAPLLMVGHSMGGVYVRMFAERHPARVRGVVLVDPGDPQFDVGIGRPAELALRAGVAGAAAQQLAGARECATGAYARNLHLLPLATVLPARDARIDRRLTAGWCRIWQTNAREGQSATRTWAQARHEPLGAGSLGSKPLSILVSDTDVQFTSDPVVNQEIMAHWRQLQRQQRDLSSFSRFQVARGTSHLVMLDRPRLVAGKIRWALRQARPSGG